MACHWPSRSHQAVWSDRPETCCRLEHPWQHQLLRTECIQYVIKLNTKLQDVYLTPTTSALSFTYGFLLRMRPEGLRAFFSIITSLVFPGLLPAVVKINTNTITVVPKPSQLFTLQRGDSIMYPILYKKVAKAERNSNYTFSRCWGWRYWRRFWRGTVSLRWQLLPGSLRSAVWLLSLCHLGTVLSGLTFKLQFHRHQLLFKFMIFDRKKMTISTPRATVVESFLKVKFIPHFICTPISCTLL